MFQDGGWLLDYNIQKQLSMHSFDFIFECAYPWPMSRALPQQLVLTCCTVPLTPGSFHICYALELEFGLELYIHHFVEHLNLLVLYSRSTVSDRV